MKTTTIFSDVNALGAAKAVINALVARHPDLYSSELKNDTGDGFIESVMLSRHYEEFYIEARDLDRTPPAMWSAASKQGRRSAAFVIKESDRGLVLELATYGFVPDTNYAGDDAPQQLARAVYEAVRSQP
jgi:hypothetical protein